MMCKLKVNVPDDFEAGDCNRCPFRQEKETNYNYDIKVSCSLGFCKSVCPLEDIITDKSIELRNTDEVLK